MESTPQRPVPTPLFIRWQRSQNRLIPALAVVLAAAAAWRLWHETPRVTGVGQVDADTADVRSAVAGEADDPANGAAPELYESVAAGRVLARVRTATDQYTNVTAPVAGQVTKVHFHPGQSVSVGERLFTIAGDRGLTITTYVRSDQRIRPEPGMAVDVRDQSDANRTFRSSVERIGPQYEAVPAGQRRDQKAEEWGLPVVISVPPSANFKPGELVYIGWLPAQADPEG